jgi:hypothetical protein
MRVAILVLFAPTVLSLTANSTLRAAAKAHGIFMGTALNTGNIANNQQYRETASAQYSLVTAENAVSTEPSNIVQKPVSPMPAKCKRSLLLLF